MSIFFNPAKHPHRLKTQPLGEQGERYNEDWPMPELDFLETVDKQQCILVDKEIRRRDAFAFPGFITGIIVFIMVFHFVFMDHYNQYTTFKDDIPYYEKNMVTYIWKTQTILKYLLLLKMNIPFSSIKTV
ncbi:hypothetical protein NFF72_18415 [Proteus mirabilis]|uniref:hypothetical protein n=1 Tax=Proteus mirabilis TaxID=584 RepID=UPI0023F8814F|nr:hypothetical protein [Proteus mirabilis]MDF7390701.1 hypothetical protein [Proteus mirabilis]